MSWYQRIPSRHLFSMKRGKLSFQTVHSTISLGTHCCVLSTYFPPCPLRAAGACSKSEVGHQSFAKWKHHLPASKEQLVCDLNWKFLASLKVMEPDCVELADLIRALQLKTELVSQDKISRLKTMSWWSRRLHLVFHGNWLALERVFTLNGEHD